MRKTIHMFRHGLTDWNLQRKLQGHTDIPLNEEGRSQALGLIPFFRDNPVDVFISSDLIRARQTAEVANQELRRPLLIERDFREVNMGELEGMTREAVAEKYGAATWERWISVHRDHADFAYPGSESAQDTVRRFQDRLMEICQNTSYRTIGLCTHGLAMRRFLHSLRHDLTEPLPTPNCVVYTVEWDAGSGLFRFY